jgi:hypothetical protein
MTDSNNNSGNSSSNGTVIVAPPTTYTISGAGGATNWVPNMITYVNVGQGWYTVSGDLSGDTTQARAVKKKDKSGCSCKKCKDYNEYAEPNQEDGSFICYRCRKGL